MNVSDTTAIAGAGGTVVSLLITLGGMILSQNKATRELIAKSCGEVQAQESKARHDENNRVAAVFTKLEADFRHLSDTAFRRDEAREMETRSKDQFHRIEAKMDRLSEQMTEMAELRATLRACTEQLSRITG